MSVNIIELQGIQYESSDSIKKRLGVSDRMLIKWRDWLPRPLKIGRKNFYDRKAVDEGLVNQIHRQR